MELTRALCLVDGKKSCDEWDYSWEKKLSTERSRLERVWVCFVELREGNGKRWRFLTIFLIKM